MEQEFFKAFEIEPKEYLRPDDEIYWGSKQETMKDVNVIYPPITPEIVLELEEIIANNILPFKKIKFYITNNDYYKDTGRKYGYETTCGYEDVYALGKTRIEALLKLCIQLKDEIQEQVKALFND